MPADPPIPPWYRFGARRRDLRTVPLQVVPSTRRSDLLMIRPVGSFPTTRLEYRYDDEGRPVIEQLRVEKEHQRRGLAERMVLRFLADHGGPGEYLSTPVVTTEARDFWRTMRDRHGIVLVRGNGRPIGLDG